MFSDVYCDAWTSSYLINVLLDFRHSLLYVVNGYFILLLEVAVIIMNTYYYLEEGGG